MAQNDNKKLKIEVVYAEDGHVHVISLVVESGTTIRQVINSSGILDECPEIDLNKNKVGIFSEICDLDTVVFDNIRVEVYRPLIADPKEARRKRAAMEKSAGN